MRSLLQRQKIGQLRRWLLVLGVGLVAYCAGLYVFLLLAVFLPFPIALVKPTAGFMMGFIVVSATAITAPSHQLVTGIVALAGAFAASCCFDLPFEVSAFPGSLCALGLVAWWFHPRRSARSIIWVGRGFAGILIAYLVVVYAFHKHWFARPSGVPYPLTLGTNTPGVAIFYQYDLPGHFMDGESLWRIGAKPEVLIKIVAELKLNRTNHVPRKFWRMPPYYWPRSMPADAEVFQSPSFDGDTRGGDGNHYFLLLDKSQGRAFVWAKFNF